MNFQSLGDVRRPSMGEDEVSRAFDERTSSFGSAIRPVFGARTITATGRSAAEVFHVEHRMAKGARAPAPECIMIPVLLEGTMRLDSLHSRRSEVKSHSFRWLCGPIRRRLM